MNDLNSIELTNEQIRFILKSLIQVQANNRAIFLCQDPIERDKRSANLKLSAKLLGIE